MTRAASHQGTEEDLGRHVRPGHVLLQRVTGQVQVGQAVQAQLVGDERRGQTVSALA